MEPTGEHSRPREDGGKPPARGGSARARSEGGSAPGGPRAWPPQDTRRKRPAEGRYSRWGDGLDREFCAVAEHLLPTTFPVASHSGVATIAMTIVARRADALLLCTFSHCGPHVWPDGEIVEPRSAAPAIPHGHP